MCVAPEKCVVSSSIFADAKVVNSSSLIDADDVPVCGVGLSSSSEADAVLVNNGVVSSSIDAVPVPVNVGFSLSSKNDADEGPKTLGRDFSSLLDVAVSPSKVLTVSTDSMMLADDSCTIEFTKSAP